MGVSDAVSLSTRMSDPTPRTGVSDKSRGVASGVSVAVLLTSLISQSGGQGGADDVGAGRAALLSSPEGKTSCQGS